jgi:hypothetical protein
MIGGFHAGILLAGGYAVFLVLVAAALERLGRSSHRLSERFEVAGFQYHPQHDRWECPTGNHLHRRPSDHPRKIVYQAPAHVCNACAVKERCTDSDTGRRIERRIDSWLQSELRRFHRGLSLAMLVLSLAILAAELGGGDTSRDRLLLGGLLLPIAGLGVKRLQELAGRQN